jgi:chromosome segregation ATPase
MNKLPYIPAIESASELLDLVANSPELHKRMKLLLETQDEINRSLKRYSEITDVQAYRANADDRMAQAEQARKEADEHVRKRREEAQAIVFDVQAFKAREAEYAKGVKAGLAKRSDELDQRESKLIARVEEVEQSGKELLTRMVEADRKLKHAQELEAEFNEKLAKMRAIA